MRTRARATTWSLGVPVVLAGLVAALGVYGYRGWFSRYTADDYCTAGAERAFGFIAAQVYWYQTWSGRFTYYIVSALIELAGPAVVQVLPSISLLLWLVVGSWALVPIARSRRWPLAEFTAALVSAALILVCLEGAPYLEQALYWQTGMLTYLLPLILWTGFAGWLVRSGSWRAPGQVSWGKLAGVAVYLFAAASLSETTLSLQLALVGLATVLSSPLLRSKRYRLVPMYLLVGLLASVVSAVVLVAAPGNVAHETSLTGSMHGLSQLPIAVQASVDFVGLFARVTAFRARPAVLVLVFVSLSCGFRDALAEDRRPGWLPNGLAAFGVVANTWILLMAATVPGYFAQQFDPPERAQFVAVWVVGLGLASGGYVLGRLAATAVWPVFRARVVPAGLRPVWTIVLLLLAVGPLLAVRDTLAQLPTDVAYAVEWDALDATIRARASAGQPVVLDHTLPSHYSFDFVGSDPGVYPNPCVARFYGIPSITAAVG